MMITPQTGKTLRIIHRRAASPVLAISVWKQVPEEVERYAVQNRATGFGCEVFGRWGGPDFNVRGSVNGTL